MSDIKHHYYDITAFNYSHDGSNNFIRDKSDTFDTTDKGDRAVYNKTSELLYGNDNKHTVECFANLQNDTLKLSIPIWIIFILLIIYFVIF